MVFIINPAIYWLYVVWMFVLKFSKYLTAFLVSKIVQLLKIFCIHLKSKKQKEVSYDFAFVKKQILKLQINGL